LDRSLNAMIPVYVHLRRDRDGNDAVDWKTVARPDS
jgi:hypothetical protein